MKSVQGHFRGACIQTFLGNYEMGAVQNAESVFEKSICTQTTAFLLHRFRHFLEIMTSVQGHFPPTRISGVPGNSEIGAGPFPLHRFQHFLELLKFGPRQTS